VDGPSGLVAHLVPPVSCTSQRDVVCAAVVLRQHASDAASQKAAAGLQGARRADILATTLLRVDAARATPCEAAEALVATYSGVKCMMIRRAEGGHICETCGATDSLVVTIRTRWRRGSAA
jgi:hypothetical protein